MTEHKGKRYYTVTELARALGRKPTTVWSQIYIQQSIPEPFATVRTCRRRLYTQESFDEIVREVGSKAVAEAEVA